MMAAIMPPANISVPGDGLQPSPAKSQKSSGCLVVAVITGFAALFGGVGVVAVLFLISATLRHSDAYRLAMQTAEASPCVVQRLGSPLKSGWFVSGSMHKGSGVGSAALDFSVSGPRDSGHMHVVATQFDQTWYLRVLNVSVDGERIDVLPTPSSCD